MLAGLRSSARSFWRLRKTLTGVGSSHLRSQMSSSLKRDNQAMLLSLNVTHLLVSATAAAAFSCSVTYRAFRRYRRRPPALRFGLFGTCVGFGAIGIFWLVYFLY